MLAVSRLGSLAKIILKDGSRQLSSGVVAAASGSANAIVGMDVVTSKIQNADMVKWIQAQAEMMRPDRVHLMDGSQEERKFLLSGLEEAGVITALNPELRPDSYIARSDPRDVARVEGATYICSEKEEDAGPTNNWCAPEPMLEKLQPLFDGCMEGRTMYVIPHCMGPLGSPISKCGVEVSDSAYVAVNMEMMTRVGDPVIAMIGDSDEWVRGVHSVGVPLKDGAEDVAWPCSPENRHICHFPVTREIFSFGSGYGGNALLGKKCFALRIASAMGRDQGWLAEHMLILGLTNPKGEKKYVAAAFPSACGKTNLAMLEPSLPGWKVETVGDDIAWLKYDDEGNLMAINPEAGMFGVAPGTSTSSNPVAIDMLKSGGIFTNVATTKDGDVWWEGLTKEAPEGLTNWLGKPHDPTSGEKAAHPNSRFTARSRNCKTMDAKWEAAEGVPISAILFGSRRSDTVPLIYEAKDWDAGVFIGAQISSERTAAAEGKQGELRNDPFAMLPFCGYHMADYFSHWIKVGANAPDKSKLPKFFCVNWFRRGNKGDENQGKFLWPGFGENSRVLEWVFRRCSGEEGIAVEANPLGYTPAPGALNVEGLGLSESAMKEVISADEKEWVAETARIAKYFEGLGPKVPSSFNSRLEEFRTGKW